MSKYIYGSYQDGRFSGFCLAQCISRKGRIIGSTISSIVLGVLLLSLGYVLSYQTYTTDYCASYSYTSYGWYYCSNYDYYYYITTLPVHTQAEQ